MAGIGRTIHDAHETAFAPKEGFPGQDKLTIVCMGIDDNWTNSDVVYTAQARTDTLFVLTLDLNSEKSDHAVHSARYLCPHRRSEKRLAF